MSGADEIVGWKRQGDKWIAPLAARPTTVLRDGGAFRDYSYDDTAKSIGVFGFDPRMHLMETVVRQNAVDLSSAADTKIEGISTADTLGSAVPGKAK